MKPADAVALDNAFRLAQDALKLLRRCDGAPLVGDPRENDRDKGRRGRDLLAAADMLAAAEAEVRVEYQRVRGYNDPRENT